MVVCIPHREREYLAAATDLGRLRIDATRNCRRSWGPARRAQQLLCRELPHQPGCPRACNSPQQFPGRRLAQLTRRTGARWLSAVTGLGAVPVFDFSQLGLCVRFFGGAFFGGNTWLSPVLSLGYGGPCWRP